MKENGSRLGDNLIKYLEERTPTPEQQRENAKAFVGYMAILGTIGLLASAMGSLGFCTAKDNQNYHDSATPIIEGTLLDTSGQSKKQ